MEIEFNLSLYQAERKKEVTARAAAALLIETGKSRQGACGEESYSSHFVKSSEEQNGRELNCDTQWTEGM